MFGSYDKCPPPLVLNTGRSIHCWDIRGKGLKSRSNIKSKNKSKNQSENKSITLIGVLYPTYMTVVMERYPKCCSNS